MLFAFLTFSVSCENENGLHGVTENFNEHVFVCTLYCGLCLFFQDELNEIVKMDVLAKVAAAEADLLSSEKQEKEKKSGSKNKKRGVIKVVEDLYYAICFSDFFGYSVVRMKVVFMA